MSTGPQTQHEDEDNIDHDVAETPQRAGILDRLYQHREFRRLRTEARLMEKPLNADRENLHELIDDMAGSLQQASQEPAPVRPNDAEERAFIDFTEAGGTALLNTVTTLEDLSAEHSLSTNANSDAWFNQDDQQTGRVAGRRRYQDVRTALSRDIQNLSDACDDSTLREAASLRRDVKQVSKEASDLITTSGDFPGGHQAIAKFCQSVRTLVNKLDAAKHAIETERARVVLSPRAQAAANQTIVDAGLVNRFESLAASMKPHVEKVADHAFWQESELRVGNTDVAAIARELVSHLEQMQGQTSTNFREVQDRYVELNRLTDAMFAQLDEHVNKPADFKIEHGKSTVQMTVGLISDALRSRYRNVALAGALAVTAVGGMLYSKNSGGPENAPKTQVTQPADTPANTPVDSTTNTAKPVSPANAPVLPVAPKGTADLGGATVEISGSNFVFTLRPSVKAAQAWVGKPGAEPVRLPLQIVNGKAVFQIPAELQNESWIGVQLDTFESGAWNPGTYKKLELK